MQEADLAIDLALMRGAAKFAGDFALEMKRSGEARHWHKEPGSPITEADVAVDNYISKTLRTARPNYGWLSEETADRHSQRSKKRVWLVDPIDGTRAFIREDDPYWCVAISLIEEGNVAASAVYAPELDMLFDASRGGGAFLNAAPISVSNRTELRGCKMITNKGMLTHPFWKEPWPEMIVADPKPNATILRLAFVAAGMHDATVALVRKSDWDVAAGAIFVTEAGGDASTHLGEPFVFNRPDPAQRSVVASATPQLHQALLTKMAKVELPNPADSGDRALTTHSKEAREMSDAPNESEQLLHIVIGGELKNVTGVEFEDLSAIDFVGAYPNYSEAYNAWKAAAQRTVDNAETRYFILHAHKLLDPETGSHHHV